MGINKFESEVLINEKIREGKDIKVAYNEVYRDKTFLKLESNKDKEIKRLIIRIGNLERNIAKLKNTNFNLGLKNAAKQEQEYKSKESQATIKDLNRILSILSLGATSISKISEDCILERKIREACLNWLARNNLITITKKDKTTIIALNGN